MRTFVIGDIHGALKALVEVIELIEIESGDCLIFLGDYVDGYSDSPAVIDYLLDLQQKQSCIFLRGNHDELLLNWFTNKIENPLWLNHGGKSTVNAYQNVDAVRREKHIAFLTNLLPYYIDNNRLFIHAGFSNLKGVLHEYDARTFSWDRTLWETAVALDPSLDKTSSKYPKRFKLYEEIYIGHTPVTQIGMQLPTKLACVWNVDTGAGFGAYLSAIEINSKDIFQSSKISDLYPLEPGRTI